MKRVVTLVLAVAGLGLFGSGVHGMTQVDGRLAEADEAADAVDVKRELGAPDDCPERRDPPPGESRRL